MGCRFLRIFNQRSIKKAIFFGIVITTVYITWTVYTLTGGKTPFFENLEHDDIGHFQQQWCRMQGWRVDWETVVKPCVGKVAWDERKVNSEWRTDAYNSFIKKWDVQPAGHFSRFFIQSVTKEGIHKNFGGDAWRVYVREGPASLAPQVLDHDDGVYEVVFLVMEPGNYSAQITLDFTLCDGLRDPPEDWIIKGTNQAKHHKDGTLGYIGDDYILEPIGGQSVVAFYVPENTHNTQKYISVVKASTCGITCNLLQNGFGRWVNGVWQPFIDNSPTTAEALDNPFTKADALCIYGDSIARYFFRSLISRGICERFFKKCIEAYMKINQQTYQTTPTNDFNKLVLQHMSEFLDSPDLSSNHSVFVFNLGVHFSIWLNFTTYKDLIDSVIRMIRSRFADEHNNKPIVIWKTTTSIEKEKTHPKNLTHWRFHTHQRLELFHKYATNAMCKAGIPVLEVYPMTASYPNGTLDHVHYSANAQRAAEDQLLAFIVEKLKDKPT